MAGPFSGSVERDAIVARIKAHPIEGQPGEQRDAFAALVMGDDAGAGERCALRIEGHGGTIVYLHGGGYTFGSPQTHARIGQALAAATGLGVMMPAYPLAPEHKWPAQLDAALAAVAEAPGPVVLAGDSAGGHLALVTALAVRRRGGDMAGLILFSPNTDRTDQSTTRAQNEPSDPMVQDEGDRELARQCFGSRPVDDPEVSPLLARLDLLPPLHIEVGGDEVLLGDSLLLAERAREVGVPVTLHVQPDGLHMMQVWVPWWASASASLDRAALFAIEATGRPASHGPLGRSSS